MVTVADEPELPVGARSPVDERLDPLERPLTPKRSRIAGLDRGSRNRGDQSDDQAWSAFVAEHPELR